MFFIGPLKHMGYTKSFAFQVPYVWLPHIKIIISVQYPYTILRVIHVFESAAIFFINVPLSQQCITLERFHNAFQFKLYCSVNRSNF